MPLFGLVYRASAGLLGPDVGKELIVEAGEWALRFLLLTLAISPLSKWKRLKSLVRYRRMIGLFSFFYATVHLLFVLTHILGWSLPVFIEEFAERPYMTAGILAWLLMVPLALTSNRRAQRKLGKRWKLVHRLVFLSAVLACIHLLWQVRSDYGEALLYSLVLLVLLLFRLFMRNSQRPAVAAN